MNTARYVLALCSIMSYPAAVGWWWVTHPFVNFWRRLGRPVFYTVLAIGSFIIMGTIYLVREPLLAVEYGTNRALWPLVLLSYGLSVYIEIRCRKHLKLKTLVGVPELAPDGQGGKLISEGIYGRIRHPRYIAVWLGTVAVAFFTNYLAVYIVAVAVVPALYLVVVLEEKELRDRFGEEYVRYCERVPRFIPRRSTPNPLVKAAETPRQEHGRRS
ncbi:MAG: isoprenylcysteine carboxylmethyltransferase family protein [Gemmatimonadota bacterium]|nr:MAG: isoprenylcysteine carboxylmethyltransferase family protein [Gemmatimonadota bacterium]